jgi:hypothetical protein
MAGQLDLDRINQLVIDDTLTEPSVTEGGAYVLLPKREEIAPLVDEIFQAPLPVSEAEAGGQQEQGVAQQEGSLMQTPASPPAVSEEDRRLTEEAARIVVHNGTEREGLAVRATEWLDSQGFLVVSFGVADRNDYSHTVLVDYTGKELTLQQLVEMFGVRPEDVRTSINLKSQVDIRLILGQDWQAP